MKGFIGVVYGLVLVYQCSTKHVPDEVFLGFSGDGSGEVGDEVTTTVRHLTTTIAILNDDNDSKYVPDEVFPGFSGDGSGEVGDELTTTVRHLTTTIAILNDDNNSKYVPDEVSPGFSGDGSGEVGDEVTTTFRHLTTTIAILNDDNDITPDAKDPDNNEKENTPNGSDDISVTDDAIIGLVVVTSLIFCIIAVLVAVIIVRKCRSSKSFIPTVYPNSRNLYISSTQKCGQSTEVLDVSGPKFDYMGQ